MSEGPFVEVAERRWKLRKEVSVGELLTIILVLVGMLYAWFDHGYRIKSLEDISDQQQKNNAALIILLQQEAEYPTHRHVDGKLLYPRGKEPSDPKREIERPRL